MGWVDSRWFVAVSGTCLVLALAGLANSYRVERDVRAARDEAIRSGVVTSAEVVGSLWSGRQRRLGVRLEVAGVERRVSVVPERSYPNGTVVSVAYLPDDPERVYIVGAMPWTWWVIQRTTFVLAAIVSFGLFVGSLLIRFERRRWRAVP
jgi:hypothetical protein